MDLDTIDSPGSGGTGCGCRLGHRDEIPGTEVQEFAGEVAAEFLGTGHCADDGRSDAVTAVDRRDTCLLYTSDAADE